MDNKIYSQYLTALDQQIDFLAVNGFPGLFHYFATVISPQNSTLEGETDNEKDTIELSKLTSKGIGQELTIKLPFAGTNFTVRMLISLYQPWIPPDFIFSDSEFMKSVSTEDLEKFVPCLNNWNYLSEDILFLFTSQVHQLYKHYQLNNLQEKEVLHFEYQSLLQDLDLTEKDIEFSVSGGNSWLASILIRLPLNIKDVPKVLIGESKDALNLLHLRIKKDDGSFIPKLMLSPQVESLLNEESGLELPSVRPGTSISDYVSTIMDIIAGNIKHVVNCFEKRKQFVADLLCQFSGSILEYDNQTFNKASFLFEVNTFHFIVEINLPKFFPKEKPVVYMQSLYQLSSRTTTSRHMPPISYNSKASSDEIIFKLKNNIIKAVSNRTAKKGSIQVYNVE